MLAVKLKIFQPQYHENKKSFMHTVNSGLDRPQDLCNTYQFTDNNIFVFQFKQKLLNKKWKRDLFPVHQ